MPNVFGSSDFGLNPFPSDAVVEVMEVVTKSGAFVVFDRGIVVFAVSGGSVSVAVVVVVVEIVGEETETGSVSGLGAVVVVADVSGETDTGFVTGAVAGMVTGSEL